nr:unnamed protein product [Sorex araneus]
MTPLWTLLALSCLRRGSGVDLQPQLASVNLATNNPTLTTVALEKPLCVFDSDAPLPGAYEVFLYVLVDSAAPYAAIDTWPGRRSGGMIVITSILGSLPFLLLVAFTGAVVLSLIDMGGFDGETMHDSQITQGTAPKSQGAAERPYPSVASRGPALDRPEAYASKLQD